MPWCEPCDAFYNPNSLRSDGRCPRCGSQVGDPDAVVTDGVDRGDTSAEDDEIVARVPWHFWVGVVAMVVYLGWRLLQGIIWVF